MSTVLCSISKVSDIPFSVLEVVGCVCSLGLLEKSVTGLVAMKNVVISSILAAEDGSCVGSRFRSVAIFTFSTPCVAITSFTGSNGEECKCASGDSFVTRT
jgi:hypothetical protein